MLISLNFLEFLGSFESLESLKTAVISVCMLSIAVAVCTLILPDTALAKQVRFLISLLLIISLAVPLADLDFPVSMQEIQQERSQETAQAVTESCLESALLALLEQEQIVCEELHVTVHIDEMNRISIREVNVLCNDFQKACRVLEQALGEEAEIHVTQILE
ncbi:MAG: hypothetical protein K2H29_01115 [Oscillospiraceae bacterium]|nr:hypothetical protein [Oscillospiraceae bacterium]MDE5883671.1 hypothetical protein [Oscillospiraceae bacterium]